MLLDYVNVYSTGGNASLAEYDDRDEPAPILRDLDEFLEVLPYIMEYARGSFAKRVDSRSNRHEPRKNQE